MVELFSGIPILVRQAGGGVISVRFLSQSMMESGARRASSEGGAGTSTERQMDSSGQRVSGETR